MRQLEGLVVDEKRVVVGAELAAVHVVERYAVAQWQLHERSDLAADIEVEQLGEESCGGVLVVRGNDGVVELDGHAGSLRSGPILASPSGEALGPISASRSWRRGAGCWYGTHADLRLTSHRRRCPRPAADGRPIRPRAGAGRGCRGRQPVALLPAAEPSGRVDTAGLLCPDSPVGGGPRRR